MGFGETLTSLVAVVGIFVMPVAAWMFSRMLKHRERMAMYRAGFSIPGPMPGVVPPPGMPDEYFRTGRRNRVRGSRNDTPDHALRKGIGLTMIGLALTIGLSFIHFDGMFHPGPWLLGGLVPLFIGLSNVLIAVLSGATLALGQYGPPPPYVPPAAGPGTAPGAPTYDGSYTYRPGDRPELRPPASPLDRR